MKTLPDGLVAVRRTPEFTAGTTPQGLLSRHRSAPGTWGRIIVVDGSLVYRILEPALEEITLVPGAEGVIEPGIAHEVVPGPGVRFFVEFHAGQPAGGG